MLRIFLIGIIVTLSFQGICQLSGDTIHIVKQRRNHVYFQDSSALSYAELKLLLANDTESKKHWKYATQNRVASNILLGLGIINFVFWSAYQLDSGDKTQIREGFVYGLVVGGTLVALSIPFRIGYKKQTLKAVQLYNQNYNSSAHLSLGFTGSGIGIAWKF